MQQHLRSDMASKLNTLLRLVSLGLLQTCCRRLSNALQLTISRRATRLSGKLFTAYIPPNFCASCLNADGQHAQIKGKAQLLPQRQPGHYHRA